MLLAIITGLAAGFVHVVSGPDHLAAVAPLSIRDRHGAWKIGLRWGIGHSTGVGLVGIALFFLKELIPLGPFSVWGERLVGIILIAIGVWGLRPLLIRKIHSHPHEHEGSLHSHPHAHDHPHALVVQAGHLHTHAAVGVGIVHGLAGSSHLLGVLPALAMPTAALTAGYLAAFMVGTIGAMTGFASCIGWLSMQKAFRSEKPFRALLVALSVIAIGVGLYWLLHRL